MTITIEREREREQNQSQIQQLRKRIADLEAIVNRTPQEEQELQNKKKELEELERQQSQDSNQKNWWPWIIGGGVILVLIVGIVAYLLGRSNKKRGYELN